MGMDMKIRNTFFALMLLFSAPVMCDPWTVVKSDTEDAMLYDDKPTIKHDKEKYAEEECIEDAIENELGDDLNESLRDIDIQTLSLDEALHLLSGIGQLPAGFDQMPDQEKLEALEFAYDAYKAVRPSSLLPVNQLFEHAIGFFEQSCILVEA